MFTSPLQARSSRNLVFLAKAFSLLVLFLLLFSPAAAAAPTVTWTPSSLSDIVAAGNTKTISVAFAVSASVDAVAVRVVPELAPFVNVSPTTFAVLAPGNTQTLTLTLSAPLGSSLGFVEGTIQLRNARRPQKVIARPLPIRLHIVPGTAEETLGYIGKLLAENHVDTALLFFSPSPLNRETLEGLTSQERSQFAVELRNARLVDEVEKVRTYELDVTDVLDGTVHTTTLSMLRTSVGQWIVMTW